MNSLFIAYTLHIMRTMNGVISRYVLTPQRLFHFIACVLFLSFSSGAQPEIFQGRGSFAKLGHFDKHFVKNSRKIGPAGKISEFFLPDTLKTTF